MRRSSKKALRFFLLLGPLAALGACGSENPDAPQTNPGSDAGAEATVEDTGSTEEAAVDSAVDAAEAGTGKEGERCRADGKCDSSNRCDPFTNICVHCDPGTLGCNCGVGDSCSTGLSCFKGECIESGKVPPKTPACYTPCKANLTSATETRVCDSDGLLPGCINGQTCVDGSCLAASETKPACVKDLDCPPYQACLGGGCYSNCVSNADCGPGLVCSLKVCRTPCTVGGVACPAGTACSPIDGTSGVCKVLAPAPATPGPMPPTGNTFELKNTALVLTNTLPTSTFKIEAQPGGTYDQKFTVRKLWHRVYRPGKAVDDVQTKIDPITKAYQTCSPAKPAACVMPWLELKNGTTTTTGDTIKVTALSGCTTACPEIVVNVAKLSLPADATRWEGELLIEGPNGTKEVHLEYSTRPEGQFSGEMYYFGTFSDEGLNAYLTGASTEEPKNALYRTWLQFKNGTLPEGYKEFAAILNSTRTGSFAFKETKKRCLELSTSGVCYPYSNTKGVRVYTTDPSVSPVPTGVSELPIALNLKADPADGTRFIGRIDSSGTLHYPGNPTVAIKLAKNPSTASCDPVGDSNCAFFLAPFDSSASKADNIARVAIGGRSLLKTGGSCGASSRVDFPWLVPGFNSNTDIASGMRIRSECRNTSLPFDSFSALDPKDENSNLAGGSPVPDGQTRERQIEFLDGALVDQNDFVLMFRESFGGFVDTSKRVYSYGFARLKRAQALLTDADYVGSTPKTISNPPAPTVGAVCDPKLDPWLNAVTGASAALTLENKINFLIQGSSAGVGPGFATVVPNDVHYLCGDTGMFDGGSGDNGAADPVRIPCPAGSNVTYFAPTTTGTLGQAAVANEACNKPDATTGKGTCDRTLKTWLDAKKVKTEVNYRCAVTGAVYCDNDMSNRRADKAFFTALPPVAGAPQPAPWTSLQGLIDDAFRYKTKFRSSTGATPGHSPTQCNPIGYDLTPYCYDAAQVEEARMRIDCLLNIYTKEHTPGVTPVLPASNATRSNLETFLRNTFSRYQLADGTYLRDGFERLYSELLVTLGDEALTAAYASRFDLAGATSAAFAGYNDGDSKKGFEKNGMDLTGVPGAEMVQLHRAVQYYQLALDRLYEHGPDFKAALQTGYTTDGKPSFISPSTVTDYLERLTRAASQKARAWSEIAKRYQQFRRPDLARRVLKRAYVATQLEGSLLDSLMFDILNRSTAASRDGVRAVIETGQITFRMSLLTMRENIAAITDDQTFFGYAPDYVPFPDTSSANAFKTLLASANSKTAAAYDRETLALTSNRTGRVDAAKFNSELVNIRTTYENQLADLCGTFVGDDGIVYPATTKYAEKSDKTRLMGDPCGNVGNGGIHLAKADIKQQAVAFSAVKLRYEHMKEEEASENTRITEQCAAITGYADLQFSTSTGIIDINAQQAESAANMHLASNILSTIASVADVSNCELTGCPAAIAKAALVASTGAATAVSTYLLEKKIAARQKEIAKAELNVTVKGTALGCDLARIDSLAKIRTIVMQQQELDLDVLQAMNNALTAQSVLESKQNEARRLQTLQTQAEQLSINVEAAQNDPNVRIYQNDAVINADFSFNDAMAAAYRLTRVYEYYTGQSYKKKEQLFLIRMVAAGTYNLQNYLVDLENAYNAYEETYGIPSLRVLKITLMDDILKIPLIDSKTNKPLKEEDRKKMMRDALLEPARLDSNGHMVLPFATTLRQLSPLTMSHKIQRVEANLLIGNGGDTIARVYLRSAGTGTVRNLVGDEDFYLFPKRTAVLNPKLNSGVVFDLEVYRNYSFRDRPLANSLWELVINQKDEMVNRDMDLQSLTDIEVFFYYTDVTSL